ncbi:hypothetical protein GCM10028832_13520 [Streptomyces sparsus]
MPHDEEDEKGERHARGDFPDRGAAVVGKVAARPGPTADRDACEASLGFVLHGPTL